jgi:hypothetical protein
MAYPPYSLRYWSNHYANVFHLAKPSQYTSISTDIMGSHGLPHCFGDANSLCIYYVTKGQSESNTVGRRKDFPYGVELD